MLDPQWIDEYLTERSLQHLSSYSIQNYQLDLRKFLAFLNDQPIEEWNQVRHFHVQSYVAFLHRTGLASESIARHLSSIRRYFHFLINHKRTVLNPAKGIRAPKGKQSLPEVLDVDQMHQLLERDPNHPLIVRDRAMFELFYSSGLRLSELVQLNLRDIDLADGMLTALGKGQKTRVVPVGKAALEALQAWLSLRPTFVREENLQAYFLSNLGKRISVRTVQERLKLWSMHQGLGKHLHPHMLRHSFATHLLDELLDISMDFSAHQEIEQSLNYGSSM